MKWLISLYQNGLNGILADQMGLGKTVQTVGFLSHLRSKGVFGPFMIVAPLSTLPNWVSEFKRWTPDFPAILYHGTKLERLAYRNEHMRTPTTSTFPVVCTSYEIVMADRKYLQKYSWKYIVVDEGHRLKNFDCKLIRELKAIPTANKLLLTGTPLQNNLPELWSLLHFLLPDVFNNLAQFQSWFDFSNIVGDGVADASKSKELMEEERRSRVVTKLHSILRPFLLRRIKGDVEHSIPKKKEIILWAHMTEAQSQFNTALVERTLSTVLQKIAEKGSGTVVQVAQVNNVLMQLRKNCNHPDLITAPYDGSTVFPSPAELISTCGKFALMHRLLERLRKRGHKVLIFSQMTRMLDLLESYLEQSGLRCCRIDGTVCWQDRQANMKQFNEDKDLFVFLLSTRAGGLGINLTGADTVIIYDSDWNPHQDMQAMDRCHRIGQARPVGGGGSERGGKSRPRAGGPLRFAPFARRLAFPLARPPTLFSSVETLNLPSDQACPRVPPGDGQLGRGPHPPPRGLQAAAREAHHHQRQLQAGGGARGLLFSPRGRASCARPRRKCAARRRAVPEPQSDPACLRSVLASRRAQRRTRPPGSARGSWWLS